MGWDEVAARYFRMNPNLPIEPQPQCNGLCMTAADVGVPEYGSMIAYPDDGCPVHGIPNPDPEPAHDWTAEDEQLWQEHGEMQGQAAMERLMDSAAYERYLGEGEWSDGR